MYNLLQFLLRYHLLIFFLLLEVFCFYLIYQNKQYNRVAYMSIANDINGKVYKTYSGAESYLYLQRMSDSLVQENAGLRAQLIESKYDNLVDTLAVHDTSGRMVQQFTYISARVIRNSVNKASNLIYLDRGAKQGVKPQMGVINPTGIVGQVVSTTDNYSAVMSVLHKDFKVSAKFKKNDFFGNLSWDGLHANVAELRDIPKHVPVEVGDTVVTSGFSQSYPRNVMIGVVKSVKAEPSKNFLDIQVTLTTGFNHLNYVYVTNNVRKTEIELLDSLVTKK